MRFVLAATVALALGLGAAAAAVVLVGPDESGEPATSSTSLEPVSGPPVRLSGTDVASGDELRLQSLTGEPVVLVVWASWCAACAGQAEPLQRLATSDEDADVVTIATQDDESAARAFLEASDVSVPTIADPDGRLAAELGVRELPTTFFLTSDHRVASVWEGRAGPGRLRAGLSSAAEG